MITQPHYIKSERGLWLPGDDPHEHHSRSGTSLIDGLWKQQYPTSARGMGRRRCCCSTPLNCGPCSTSDGDFIINIGAGGYSNGLCSNCTVISGEFLAPRIGTCTWQYQNNNWCTVTYGGGTGPAILKVFLYLLSNPWYWYGGVEIKTSVGSPIVASTSIYQTTTSTDTDCMSLAVDGILTLTKIGDYHNAAYVCSGAMPATITAYRP